MNIYVYIIIGIILFEYLLSFVVRTLNLKALDPNLPEEFKDTFDDEKYIKSQKYTKANSKFAYITSTLNLFVSLVFIFGGVYNIIDLVARSYGYGNILTGLIFFGLLTIITDLISLPFSMYSTFVIEEKFGFNKTTYKTYFTDKLKAYFLMLVIGAPLMYVVLYFFEYFGAYAWIYAWIFMVSFSIIFQPLYNIFISFSKIFLSSNFSIPKPYKYFESILMN